MGSGQGRAGIGRRFQLEAGAESGKAQTKLRFVEAASQLALRAGYEMTHIRTERYGI